MKLDYRSPDPTPHRTTDPMLIVVGATIAFVPAPISVAGYVLGDGSLFLGGGFAAALFAVLSVIGIGLSRGGAAVGWGFALLTNGLTAGYVVWLICARGTC